MDLEYDASYHLNCRLTLTCGRSVLLAELHQWMTYAGWLEGVPSCEWNDWKIKGALERARRYGQGFPPHLIPPQRRDYLRHPGDMETSRALRGLPAEWLPMVTCIGVFRDVVPARDKSMDQSYLTVVWYQDEFALPITDAVLDQLRALDWETLATDVQI
jgi:hypothetical protein